MGGASLPLLRRHLLALIGANPPLADDIRKLDSRDWQRIGAMAAQYGMGPLLHVQCANGPLVELIPAPVQVDWAAAHRLAGFRALTQRRDLRLATRLLGEAGIHPVALKGAWLAWYAWLDPALRPMGDIDLLVRPDQALTAFEYLRDAGYKQEKPFELSPAETVRTLKHLPPLVSPEGTMFEVHMRCWPEPEEARPGPVTQDGRMLARARIWDADDPVFYPEVDDMLVHVLVHGTYDFRLNCGPLGLVDCDMMIARYAFDWQEFWERARANRWDRGAALMLALADRWRRPGLLAESRCPLTIPGEVLDTAPDLLLQDLLQTTPTQFLADLQQAASRGSLLTAMRARLAGKGIGGVAVSRDFSGHGGYWSWLRRKAEPVIRAAASGDAWGRARDMARLRHWLTGG